MLTDIGPVEIEVPRDRAGSFEPQIVRKRQRRLSGVDEMVLSLSARGLTHGEISGHLREVYGAEVSKTTISTITDKVMDGMAEWQNRPLDSVYPVIFIDCVHVKIRDGQVANRPIYMALAVTCDGMREILGLCAGDGGEGAKYWMHVLTEIKNRGVADVCMVVCDGLRGLPEAIEAVWPRAVTQTCVVHRSRQQITRCFGCLGSLTWYANIRRGPRAVDAAVRGSAAASERASASSCVGGRGAAAWPWGRAVGRAGRRGQRDHGAQGCVRARGWCGAAGGRARAAARWWAVAGGGC